MATWSDGFEDGDVSEYHSIDTFWAEDTTALAGDGAPRSGSYSGYYDSSSGGTHAEKDFDGRIDTFEGFYLESESSTGGGIKLVDSNNNVVVGFATDNPQWVVHEAGGFTEIYGGDNYEAWHRVTVLIDYSTGTADITWEDESTGGHTETYTASLRNSNEAVEFQIDDYTGWGGWSSGSDKIMRYDDFTVEYSPPPDAPSNVSALASGDDNTVTWNDNSTTEDGFHIDRHYDGSWTRVTTVGVDTTSHIDSNRLNGEEYRYRVRAYSNFGTSDWAYSNYVMTSLPAPSGATQTIDSPTAITVSFSDHSDNENHFRVEKRVDGGAWTHAGDVAANTTSQQFTVSKSADSFRWRVRAETEHTTSGWTYTNTVATDGSGLTATVISGTQIDLAWDAEQDVDEYHLYRAQAASSSLADYIQVATIAAETTTHSDTGLETGEEYQYRVAPVYGGAEDDPSTDVAATTDLPAGSNVTLNTSVEDEVSLDWMKEDNSPDGNWEILRSTDSSTGSVIATITDVTQTSYTDTGRTDGERYYYTIRRNTDHVSADSPQTSAVTFQPAPTNLQSPAHGFTFIDITWMDNHDYGETRIDYRPSTPDGEPDEPWQVYSTVARGTESETLSGLRHGEQYDLRAVAVTEHTETEDI